MREIHCPEYRTAVENYGTRLNSSACAIHCQFIIQGALDSGVHLPIIIQQGCGYRC